MTTIHHSPPPGATPFAIYEDPEDQEPPSPSETYEGDVSFSSELSLPGADEVLPSIENEQESTDIAEIPYKSSYTSRRSILSNSRRTSGVTSTSFISSLPSEISIASKPVAAASGAESRYTPRKERPPFRNPSSVRAMQMASPPPLPAIEASRERLKGTYKLATPSRSSRSESVSTTSTRRSRHRDSMHRETPVQQDVRPTPTPQQHFPLVLLHVTILPLQLPYAHEFMVKHMPEWLVENYRLLAEKLQDIVLMRRGLLIPHPRDEYDELEERILESLELRTPRLLKCGHFLGPDAETDENREEDDNGSVTDDATGRGSRMSGGTIINGEEAGWKYPTPEADDASVCTDCHRQVKRPGKGVGVGTKRWDIKIFAANGLMRAGAWSAAWSEMERCDVEISPWIPEELRKSLEILVEEEQEIAQRKQLYAEELRRQMEEEAARQKKLEDEVEVERRAAEAELQQRIEAEAIALQRKLEEEALEKRRLEETLNEKIEMAKEAMRLEFEAQAMAEANAVAGRLRAVEEALKREQEKTASRPPPTFEVPDMQQYARSVSRGRPRPSPDHPQMEDIPIGTLLKNYFLLLLQDSRNFFILLLGALVVFFGMHMDPNVILHRQSLDLAPTIPVDYMNDALPSVVVTSTATMTATSTSIVTVTEAQTLESLHASSQPSISAATSEVAEAASSVSSQNVETLTASSILEQPSVEDLIPVQGSSETDEAWIATPETASVAPEEAISIPSDPTSLGTLDKSTNLPSASELESASPSPEPASSDTELPDEDNIPEPSPDDLDHTLEPSTSNPAKDEL